MPEGLFTKLPAGPACERCSARTYIASVEPHPTKRLYTRYCFECPRCYHLMRVTVAPRRRQPEAYDRVTRFVAEAELRVERQAALVRRLRHAGRDTARAEALLEILEQSLEALRAYQDYVMRSMSHESEDETGS